MILYLFSGAAVLSPTNYGLNCTDIVSWCWGLRCAWLGSVRNFWPCPSLASCGLLRILNVLPVETFPQFSWHAAWHRAVLSIQVPQHWFRWIEDHLNNPILMKFPLQEFTFEDHMLRFWRLRFYSMNLKEHNFTQRSAPVTAKLLQLKKHPAIFDSSSPVFCASYLILSLWWLQSTKNWKICLVSNFSFYWRLQQSRCPFSQLGWDPFI